MPTSEVLSVNYNNFISTVKAEVAQCNMPVVHLGLTTIPSNKLKTILFKKTPHLCIKTFFFFF